MVKKYNHLLIPLLILAALVWIIYFPVPGFEFLQWDDDYNIYDNPYFKEGAILPFWQEPYMGLYIPLVYTIWSFLYHLTAAPDPTIFHVFNINLHIVNSFLVFLFIKKVIDHFKPESNNLIAALTGAILFAIHPLQIGGVAWISGGRDLMSIFFVLLSLNRYFDRKNIKDLIWSFVFFGLALLCKPGAVSLPAFFVVIDLVLGRKWLATIPFFIAGLVFIPVTKAAQSIYMVGMTHQDLLHRPIIALDAIGFYVSKIFFPMNLAVDYGRLPARVISQQLFWPYLFIALAWLTLIYFLWKKQRSAILGISFSGLMLAPVLGIIPFNFQRISTVTDHYMYLPMIGVCLVLALFSPNKWNWKFHVPMIAFCLMLMGFGINRIPVWREHFTFFNDMKEKNPMSHSAYIMLGDRYFRKGDVATAEKEFYGSVIADPKSAVAAGNIGYVLVYQGKFKEAIDAVTKYIDNPEFDYVNQVHPHTIGMVYLSYGTALWKTGNPLEGFKRICEVFRYKPRQIDANQAITSMRAIEEESPFLHLRIPESCPYLQKAN
jgi:hypothetical protein